MRSELIIRFDYGHIVPWVRRVDHARVAIAGPDALCLRTPVDIHGEERTTVSDFIVRPGDRVPFVLTWFPSHEDLPEPVDAEVALDESASFWLGWANADQHHGPHHEDIHQSLLVLKALTYAPTGGIVASPTTSLPERIGGVRNWDYRSAGPRRQSDPDSDAQRHYRDEALAWREWLLRTVAGDPGDVQIMYGVAGERRIEERIIPWLPGFADSQPVRVGNAASHQRQLDIYGEVLDAAYQTLAQGIEGSEFGWSLVKQLLAWLADHWHEEDAGIGKYAGRYGTSRTRR
jgi:GH15 family glucan-1,4-alpha-glucosidase